LEEAFINRIPLSKQQTYIDIYLGEYNLFILFYYIKLNMSNYLSLLKKNITGLLDLKENQVKFMEDKRSDGEKTSQYQIGIYIDSVEKYATIKSKLIDYISSHTECESLNNDKLKCISYSSEDNSGKSSEYSIFYPEEFKETMYYTMGHAVCERLILSRRFLLKSLVVQFLNRLGSMDVKAIAEEESRIEDKKLAEATELAELKKREEEKKNKEDRFLLEAEEKARAEESALIEERKRAELEADKLAAEAPGTLAAKEAAEKAAAAARAMEEATAALRNANEARMASRGPTGSTGPTMPSVVRPQPTAQVRQKKSDNDDDDDEEDDPDDVDIDDPNRLKLFKQSLKGGTYNIHPRYSKKIQKF
jgi:hypothetical protein